MESNSLCSWRILLWVYRWYKQFVCVTSTNPCIYVSPIRLLMRLVDYWSTVSMAARKKMNVLVNMLLITKVSCACGCVCYSLLIIDRLPSGDKAIGKDVRTPFHWPTILYTRRYRFLHIFALLIRSTEIELLIKNNMLFHRVPSTFDQYMLTKESSAWLWQVCFIMCNSILYISPCTLCLLQNSIPELCTPFPDSPITLYLLAHVNLTVEFAHSKHKTLPNLKLINIMVFKSGRNTISFTQATHAKYLPLQCNCHCGCSYWLQPNPKVWKVSRSLLVSGYSLIGSIIFKEWTQPWYSYNNTNQVLSLQVWLLTMILF